jgi:LysR family glycine cleavage system transcriptional activator
MHPLKKRLATPNALLTFEAAARHLSFTRAAAELFVSQAAVSRQIRRLEDRLGTELFRRKHRALELTEPGNRLHQAVTLGLGHIAQAMDGIVDSGHEQIQIATTVAFATYWVAPRLSRFRANYPSADVRVLASDHDQDQLTDAVDLALVCGHRDVPGWTMARLFPEVVFPICSPAYLERHSVSGPEDLPNHPLLHLDRRHWEDVGWTPVDWTVWLEKFGIAYEPPHPIVTFNNYPMLVDAALDGEGIALGWRHLSERHLAQDWLVRPIKEEWDFERSYYLAFHQRPAPSSELLALHDWLLQDVQKLEV